MKKLYFLSLFISVSAFAFGGGGGSSSGSARYETGVDSFGTHFGGEGQVQIQFNCVPDEQAPTDWGLCTCLTENATFDYDLGKCTCKKGWRLTKKGTCEFPCEGEFDIVNANGECETCPYKTLPNDERTKCNPCYIAPVIAENECLTYSSTENGCDIIITPKPKGTYCMFYVGSSGLCDGQGNCLCDRPEPLPLYSCVYIDVTPVTCIPAEGHEPEGTPCSTTATLPYNGFCDDKGHCIECAIGDECNCPPGETYRGNGICG